LRCDRGGVLRKINIHESVLKGELEPGRTGVEAPLKRFRIDFVESGRRGNLDSLKVAKALALFMTA
jgi:hypothetical protein